MITSERMDELHSAFREETSEEHTQEWRDDLNEEESVLIDQWDKHYNQSILKICKSILEVN